MKYNTREDMWEDIYTQTVKLQAAADEGSRLNTPAEVLQDIRNFVTFSFSMEKLFKDTASSRVVQEIESALIIILRAYLQSPITGSIVVEDFLKNAGPSIRAGKAMSRLTSLQADLSKMLKRPPDPVSDTVNGQGESIVKEASL